MCTVSFFKNQYQVIITSNRDESAKRPNALAPRSEYVFGKKLFFPKDPQGGGTWFVVNEQGSTFVLLNGAEFNHIPKSHYGKSRGVILLEIAAANAINIAWKKIDLSETAPFTIVAYVKNELTQLRWDGKKKETKELLGISSMIWSSSTLYSLKTINDRTTWFRHFISEKSHKLAANDLIDFHTNTRRNDTENGLVIDRNGQMLTKSVTQFILEKGRFSLLHIDLPTQTKTISTYNIC